MSSGKAQNTALRKQLANYKAQREKQLKAAEKAAEAAAKEAAKAEKAAAKAAKAAAKPKVVKSAPKTVTKQFSSSITKPPRGPFVQDLTFSSSSSESESEEGGSSSEDDESEDHTEPEPRRPTAPLWMHGITDDFGFWPDLNPLARVEGGGYRWESLAPRQGSTNWRFQESETWAGMIVELYSDYGDFPILSIANPTNESGVRNLEDGSAVVGILPWSYTALCTYREDPHERDPNKKREDFGMRVFSMKQSLDHPIIVRLNELRKKLTTTPIVSMYSPHANELFSIDRFFRQEIGMKLLNTTLNPSERMPKKGPFFKNRNFGLDDEFRSQQEVWCAVLKNGIQLYFDLINMPQDAEEYIHKTEKMVNPGAALIWDIESKGFWEHLNKFA